MKVRKYRKCGICGVEDIPRIEWPWWKDGKPVHVLCLDPSQSDVLDDVAPDPTDSDEGQG